MGRRRTEAVPFIINDEADLMELVARDFCWQGGYVFEQTAHITVTAPLATPIGDGEIPFNGTYRGNVSGGPATMTNLRVATTINGGMGLFGTAIGTDDTPVVLDNLNLVDAAIAGADATDLATGSLVGYAEYVDVSRVNVTLDDSGVSKNNNGVGGLAGRLKNSTVTDVSVSGGQVRGLDAVGGLAGLVDGASVISDTSVSVGRVNGRIYVGGVVGALTQTATIRDVDVDGVQVTGTSLHADGVAGYAVQTSVIDDVEVRNVNVQGPIAVGGVAGTLAESAVVTESTVLNVNVSATTFWAGGVVGYLATFLSARVEDVTVTLADDTGVTALTHAGGAVGYQVGGTLTGISVTSGRVTGLNRVGGLVGFAESFPVIEQSMSYADVTTTEGRVGGLMGGAVDATVSQSYATGTVSGGAEDIGGLIGRAVRTTVTDSYAQGPVSNAADTAVNVGGLIGLANGTGLTHVYCTGTVSGFDIPSSGAMVGTAVTSDDTSSYYDSQTSGRLASALGEGKTTEQMQALATFTGWSIQAGWTGSTPPVWGICEGSSYPFLQALTASDPCGTPPPPPPPPPVDPPSAPRDVTGVGGNAAATVSWMTPASSGSFPITNYQVVANPGGASCLTQGPTLTCDVTGLTNGTSYTFTARALNGAGWGPFSTPSDPVLIGEVPGHPGTCWHRRPMGQRSCPGSPPDPRARPR